MIFVIKMCDRFDFEDDELTEELILIFNKWEEGLKVVGDTGYTKRDKINMFKNAVENVLIDKLL